LEAIKVDFHVGEYVELADGSVGYIVRFYDSSDYAGLVRLRRKTIEVRITASEKDEGSLRSILVYEGDSLSDYFARVGNRKLREDKKNKIKPVNTDGVFVSQTELLITNKVDELVEAVNKINEQLAKER
jgi:hypothetical protein